MVGTRHIRKQENVPTKMKNREMVGTLPHEKPIVPSKELIYQAKFIGKLFEKIRKMM